MMRFPPFGTIRQCSFNGTIVLAPSFPNKTTVALCHVLLELLESCQRGQFKPLIMIIIILF